MAEKRVEKLVHLWADQTVGSMAGPMADLMAYPMVD